MIDKNKDVISQSLIVRLNLYKVGAYNILQLPLIFGFPSFAQAILKFWWTDICFN